MGSDYLPSQEREVLMAGILILIGAIGFGVLVGEFSTLLSDADKAKRKFTENFDKLVNILSMLKMPEEIHKTC